MNFNAWEWPQWVYVGMTFIGLMMLAHKHGKPKTGNVNIWSDLIAVTPIWITLYFGGFFK